MHENLPVLDFRFRFVGVGGAFEPRYGNSAAVMNCGDGRLLLIDCGGATYTYLCLHGLTDRIEAVLVTHLHDDHVGSLGSLIFHHRHLLNRTLPVFVPPKLFPELHQFLTLQSRKTADNVLLYMEEHQNGNAEIGNVKVGWLDTTGHHGQDMVSYAYLLTDNHGTVAYSGDLGNPDLLFEAIEQEPGKTIVFHDCCWTRLANRAHAHYKDLERHLERWRILGYHNDPRQEPDDNRIPLAINTDVGELTRKRLLWTEDSPA